MTLLYVLYVHYMQCAVLMNVLMTLYMYMCFIIQYQYMHEIFVVIIPLKVTILSQVKSYSGVFFISSIL